MTSKWDEEKETTMTGKALDIKSQRERVDKLLRRILRQIKMLRAEATNATLTGTATLASKLDKPAGMDLTS